MSTGGKDKSEWARAVPYRTGSGPGSGRSGSRAPASRRVAAALSVVALALILAGGAHAAVPAAQDPGCAAQTLAIEAQRIWVDAQGGGDITVVFEAGFGNDASVWAAIAPRVRAMGVRTLAYDRAGMGHSSLDASQPYSIGHDAQVLQSVLDACRVASPVLFVGHSYGGAIGLLASTRDHRIRSLVLLDAVVPGAWPESEVAKNVQAMRAQYDEIREKAPELAKVAIPFAEAMTATASTINALQVPTALPIVDIVAEKGQHDADSAATWVAAHRAFDTAGPSRRYVLAAGSSHKVMVDRPDLVVQSIGEAIEMLRHP